MALRIDVTPNWFTTVMGTAIVANATVMLPVHSALSRLLACGIWLAATGWLTVLTAASLTKSSRNAQRLALDDPILQHYYGAPPMALLTVGAGTISFGPAVLGNAVSLHVGGALWVMGTAGGLLSAAAVAFRVFTRHPRSLRNVFAGWLLPVVPPMVSAATGAALIARVPTGQWRISLLVACYVLFGLSALATLTLLPLICARLAQHGLGPIQLIPTWWIVLGPLGQSITAAGLLGSAASLVVPEPVSTSLRTFGLLYGSIVCALAAAWAVFATLCTVRAFRAGLAFSLAWWSFTFPIGTWASGCAVLGSTSGLAPLKVFSVVLYAVLVAAWLRVVPPTIRLVRRSSRQNARTLGVIERSNRQPHWNQTSRSADLEQGVR